MSPEKLEKMSHPEVDISKDNLISVRKWGNEQTDRLKWNFKVFGTSVWASKECIQKIPERCFIQK